MRTIKFTTPCLLIQAIVFWGQTLAQGAPRELATVKAPPLVEGKAAETNNLGTWDDAFVCRGQDFLVLRRGDELFSMRLDALAEPKKLLASPIAAQTRIIAATAIEERLWLFF